MSSLMQEKQGYKETKIGSIPEDWEVVKYNNIAEFKNGINFTADQRGEKGILTADVLNMYGTRINLVTENLYRVNIEIKDKNNLLKKGDILFVRSSLMREGVGWASLFNGLNEDISYCGFLIRARNNLEKINPEFLTYFLRSYIGRKQIVSFSGTVTITNIGQEDLGFVRIPLPPLPEQKKIAEILNCIDDSIEKTDEIIKQAEELKKGLMQELFTKGLGHTEFQETKIGTIPKEWEVVKLKEILNCSPEYGANASAIKYSESETYRYVRITDINDYGRLNDELVGIRKEEGEKYILEENDLIIARTGNTVGKSFLYSNKYGKCSYAGYLIRFKINQSKYNVKFLSHFLHSPLYWNWVYSNIRVGAQPNINSQEYQTLNLPMPPLFEQEKISKILNEADKKIETERNYKNELEELKKGLMQDLLTGKRRVKV